MRTDLAFLLSTLIGLFQYSIARSEWTTLMGQERWAERNVRIQCLFFPDYLDCNISSFLLVGIVYLLMKQMTYLLRGQDLMHPRSD